MRKFLIAVGLALAAFVYVVLRGDTLECVENPYWRNETIEKADYSIEQDHEVIRIDNFRIEDNSIKYMSRLFDRLNDENSLPKTMVFNLNPKMNTEIMTLIGCFQSGEAKGKLQYGPAWWFLDNKVGMHKHLEDLTATGHIGAFVGMLTDSRSFLSYPRHHYFRRILCDYLGKLMENGEITQDENLVGSVIKDVCYNNAIKYFGV